MTTNDQSEAPPGELGPVKRFRESLRRNPVLNTAWRAGVFAAGAAVLAAGLVMMVTPGPGIVAIVLGLAILATEFAWAQTALHRARAAAERARQKALDPRKRRRNTVLTGLLAGALALGYLAAYGLALPWNIEDLTFWN